MNYREMRTLLICGAVLWLAACEKDITGADAGDVIGIGADKAIVVVSPGDSVNVTAWAFDATNSRIGTAVSFTPIGSALTVATDTFLPELAESRATIRVLSTASAGTGVVLEAGGLQDTVYFVVASPGTAAGAPALIFRSMIPVFTEDIDVDVAGAHGTILSRTDTELAVLLPFGAEGELDFEFFGFGTDANVDLPGVVVVSGAPLQEASEAGASNDTRATAAPAALNTDIYGAVSGDDVNDWYSFEVTEAGSYTFLLNWNDHADVDFFPRNAAGSALSGGAATSAQPEQVTLTLAPGTYYVQVEMYATDPDATLPVTTYTLRVSRNP